MMCVHWPMKALAKRLIVRGRVLLGCCLVLILMGFQGLEAKEPKLNLDSANWIENLRASAEDGDPMLQLNIGIMYLEGKGLPKDVPEAVRWFKKSAEKGCAFGMVNLGKMYFNGWGITPDNIRAYAWVKLGFLRFKPGKIKDETEPLVHFFERSVLSETAREEAEKLLTELDKKIPLYNEP